MRRLAYMSAPALCFAAALTSRAWPWVLAQWLIAGVCVSGLPSAWPQTGARRKPRMRRAALVGGAAALCAGAAAACLSALCEALSSGTLAPALCRAGAVLFAQALGCEWIGVSRKGYGQTVTFMKTKGST